MKINFKNWQEDLPAGLVVFLVALPLCLGVGLASTNLPEINGLPNLFTGIIAGIIGGTIVGFFSQSRLGVSGPAAGLISIILSAITLLGSYEAFLVSVVLSGIIQIIAGFLNAGVISNYFPTSVIKGMLAAIGITLILKEIPHVVGYDADFFGDEAFFQPDGHNTLSELLYAFNSILPGSLLVGITSIILLILLEKDYFKKLRFFQVIPLPLLVVITGIAMNFLFTLFIPEFKITENHLVQLPVANSLDEFFKFFTFPNFQALTNPNVYVIAFTLALVGSLETLLSLDATDKLDPEKPITPTNRELKAQGIGNMFSGMLGGLPVTQVIVRSSANINAGAKSNLSTIFHGLLLLLAVLFFPTILNFIPLATLAGILIIVGYKLAKVSLFKQMIGYGKEQSMPFLATIIGILFTDLLRGIAIGICVSIFYVLKKNLKNNFTKKTNQNKEIEITLAEEITFLNKGTIMYELNSIEPNSSITINGSNCQNIDFDVMEFLRDFVGITSKSKNIKVTIVGIKEFEKKNN
jgi:MFS superfamily sulfate permease-like transporter